MPAGGAPSATASIAGRYRSSGTPSAASGLLREPANDRGQLIFGGLLAAITAIELAGPGFSRLPG
jgi:hypothetical protein